MRVIGKRNVERLLMSQEMAVMDIVRNAYIHHFQGDSSLPHSIFLRFPNDVQNRIIGLPAYLNDGEVTLAGMKWISSFPANIERGIERASAVIILNDMSNGQPIALIEGSVISAKRTAASAALAAKHLHDNPSEEQTGLIGCGRINEEILRFLKVAFPLLKDILLYDMSRERVERFIDKARQIIPEGRFTIAECAEAVFVKCDLVSLATTAGTPFIHRPNLLRPTSTVLDISLRDVDPTFVLACENYVDDVNHVCREKTSMDLTCQATGNREFIRGTLAEVLLGNLRRNPEKSALFSPFGLGILDLAVAGWVYSKAETSNLGMEIQDFM